MLIYDYIPILVMMGLAGFLVVFFLLGSMLLGPKLRSPVKDMPFECGHPSEGHPRRKFSVKFHRIAILFILFDIEVVFLFPWAVVLGRLELFALVSMLIFLAIFILADVYAWVKGGLEWD